MADLVLESLALLSERENTLDEWECIECVNAEVEMACFSFLNGHVTAFVPLLTFFLSEAAVLDSLDDLVEDVSVDVTILET